jgi:hypothetical protein
MSAAEQQGAEWLGSHFWDRLERLEGRHQQVQSQHERVRRGLERVSPLEAAELRNAWRRYCEVIAESMRLSPRSKRCAAAPADGQSPFA